ncbi:carboxypeptidase-like regulatory domain-containing protein, partial [Salinibacter altiplanensis]|uniref:carboxypeptidase-like regulatory domain-containing protein n=1 Tax=Salinibacter altiplanensis TaxID=1803181 RepID=UPI0018F8A685
MVLPSILRRIVNQNRLLCAGLPLLCVFVLFADPASGQSRGAVAGQVTTPDGEPLPGVQVVDPTLQRGATTGPDGQYRLDRLPTGTHTLEYRFVGFQTAVQEVSLAAGKTAEVDVALQSRVLETEGVTVTGTARARSTLTTPQSVDVLNEEDLDVNRSASLGDLLSNSVAGVSSIKTGSQAGK